MSDWGAVHSTVGAANDGLDQFTGFCCVADKPWFAPPAMKAALQSGAIPQARLDDMVERILWALFAKGPVDDPVKITPIDYAAHALVSQKAAEESLVLLKNDGDLLPLRGVKSIAVIGGSADKGVLAGAGSSDVTPVGGAVMIDKHTYLALAAARCAEARAAAGEDRVRRWQPIRLPPRRWPRSPMSRSSSSPSTTAKGREASLSMVGNQDALVAAVARANPKTIVVAETGGAIYMPWVERGARDPRSLLSGHSRRPGDRADPDRQGQSVGPSADQLPGLGRPARAPGHRRARRARRNARRSHSTMKARRSATNGMT